MRLALLVLLFVFLSGCGGSSSSPQSVPSSQQNDNSDANTENSVPILSSESSFTGVSGGLLTIAHDVSDPDNDEVTLDWITEVAQLQKVQSTLSSTSFRLPEVDETIELPLVLKATDSNQGEVSKSITITVHPKSDSIQIDLASSFSGAENTLLKLFAVINSEIGIEEVTWQIPDELTDNTSLINSISGTSGKSTLEIQLPQVNKTTTYNAIVTVKTSEGMLEKTTAITIVPENEDFLSISLPESYVVDEKKEGEISVTINSSDEAPIISWRWLDANITLQNASGKTVRFTAPETQQDTTHNLEVTVEAANTSAVAVVPVTFNDVPVYSDISLSANRTLAVKGQAVYVDVQTENPEQISEVKWSVTNLSSDAYTASNEKLTIVVPEVASGLFVDLQVRANITLTNGQSSEHFEQIRVLSEGVLHSEVKISAPTDEQDLLIYNNTKNDLSLNLTGSYELIDSVEVDLPFSLVEFSKKNASIEGEQIKLSLQSDKITKEAKTNLQIVAYMGDYKVTKYIQVRLLPSKYSIYPGYEESYVMGSEIQLFSQLMYENELTEGNVSWQKSRLTGELIDPDSLTPRFASSRYSYGEVEFSVTFQDGDNQTTSDLELNFGSYFEQSQGDMNCTLRLSRVTCLYDGRLVDFDLDTRDAKQLKLNDEVACVITQAETLTCTGNSTNVIITEIITPQQEMVRLNLVDNSNACVQYVDGKWQCWGSRKTFNQQLIAQFSLVHHLVQYKGNTCLVGGGFLQCFNDVGEPTYKDMSDTVKYVEVNNSGICYDYTASSSAVTSECPTELK